MRFILFAFVLVIPLLTLRALDVEIQFENEKVRVLRVKMMPGEEIGLHRDTLPQIVVPLQGGVITRLEADGMVNEIQFPTGQAIFREVDPPDLFHRSVNCSAVPLELIIIQLKETA